MESIREIQEAIEKLENYISLRQISIQSDINYITLRNIKFGKSSRVTENVLERFKTFYKKFKFDTASPRIETRGRKPVGRKAAKPVVKTKPKPTVKEKQAAQKKEPVQGIREQALVEPILPVTDMYSPILGDKLKQEIELAEKRLAYLRALEKAEEEFLTAIGKK